MTTPKAIRRWLKRNNPDYRLIRTEYLLNLQEERDTLALEVEQLKAMADRPPDVGTGRRDEGDDTS